MVHFNGKYTAQYKRGVSMLELIIAFAIASMALLSLVVVSFSNQRFVIDASIRSHLNAEATLILDKTIKKGFDDFMSIHSSTTTSDDVQTMVTATPTNPYSKRIDFVLSSLVSPEYTIHFQTEIYDFKNAFGHENCLVDSTRDWEDAEMVSAVTVDPLLPGTDVAIAQNKAYITTNSATISKDDFFIIDIADPLHPAVVSHINTGPGLATVTVAGKYAYVANTSTTAQLQVIDISDAHNPKVVAALKLPSTGLVKAVGKSIFYSDSKVYLGTTKADGAEFAVIDVYNPLIPTYGGGFETNTGINAILVKDSYAYLATPTIEQIKILDVSNPSDVREVDSFSSSGYETQEGESLYLTPQALYFGRSVGGVNKVTNHEFFSLSLSSSTLSLNMSKDIAASVNGIVVVEPLAFLATNDTSKEFQVWNMNTGTLTYTKNMGATAVALHCYKDMLLSVQDGGDLLRILRAPPF